MKNTHLYAIWAVLFIICAGLGFIPASSGLLAGGMTVLVDAEGKPIVTPIVEE